MPGPRGAGAGVVSTRCAPGLAHSRTPSHRRTGAAATDARSAQSRIRGPLVRQRHRRRIVPGRTEESPRSVRHTEPSTAKARCSTCPSPTRRQSGGRTDARFLDRAAPSTTRCRPRSDVVDTGPGRVLQRRSTTIHSDMDDGPGAEEMPATELGAKPRQPLRERGIRFSSARSGSGHSTPSQSGQHHRRLSSSRRPLLRRGRGVDACLDRNRPARGPPVGSASPGPQREAIGSEDRVEMQPIP